LRPPHGFVRLRNLDLLPDLHVSRVKKSASVMLYSAVRILPKDTFAGAPFCARRALAYDPQANSASLKPRWRVNVGQNPFPSKMTWDGRGG
jgi:hypothetical protein